jgi:hypothetical protein
LRKKPLSGEPAVKLWRAILPLMLAPSAEESRTYDVCINIAGRRLYWRNPNHGITLGSDTIAWTMDGEAMTTPYGAITEVHLDSIGQKTTTERCTITFGDGRGLLIVNTDPGGYRDSGRAAAYRDFVRDLHARLAAKRYPGIRFTAGVPRWRYRLMLGSAIVGAPLFALVGLGGYFLYHVPNGPILFAGGEFFCWSLGRRALANAPRDYTPDQLPDQLLA